MGRPRGRVVAVSISRTVIEGHLVVDLSPALVSLQERRLLVLVIGHPRDKGQSVGSFGKNVPPPLKFVDSFHGLGGGGQIGSDRHHKLEADLKVLALPAGNGGPGLDAVPRHPADHVDSPGGNALGHDSASRRVERRERFEIVQLVVPKEGEALGNIFLVAVLDVPYEGVQSVDGSGSSITRDQCKSDGLGNLSEGLALGADPSGVAGFDLGGLVGHPRFVVGIAGVLNSPKGTERVVERLGTDHHVVVSVGGVIVGVIVGTSCGGV
mmetsp:Transcript_7818/g.19408  ORF Transcript_7818/g.19408 Transcript_7818/m.19408 type:complete len:267 (+) Transcript_7818:1715-2515(+)